jgi:hypothetical protein
MRNNVLKTDAELSIIQDRVGQIIAGYVEEYRRTGSFPTVTATPGVISITSQIEGERAVYEASSPAILGKVIARVSGNGGALYWKGAKREQLLVFLVRGRVRTVEGNNITLQDVSGRDRYYKAAVGSLASFQGEQVMAVVDPQTRTASSLYRVD